VPPSSWRRDVSQDVVPLVISDAIRDPDTGEYQFPDPDRDNAPIVQIQHQLAAHSGVPLEEILKEQEERLPQGTPQNPPRAQPQAKTDPALPALDEDQLELLTFLSNHPDLPVNAVYKQAGIAAARVSKVRDALKEMGLLVELDVRTGRSGAGRPTKFMIPTFHAFALLGKDPPAGRGGEIHRAIQHTVTTGAIAKGYTTKTEYPLPTGAIVDVHLEKGGEKIAVEIAVLSHPHREVAHVKACLQASYDKIIGIFVSDDLLARTQAAIGEELSPSDATKVRLLPISLLPLVE
jgi:hypothetical protein